MTYDPVAQSGFVSGASDALANSLGDDAGVVVGLVQAEAAKLMTTVTSTDVTLRRREGFKVASEGLLSLVKVSGMDGVAVLRVCSN